MREALLAHSHCVYIKGLSDVHEIQFHGQLARIPSLKNSKLPGCNFHNPNVTARLKAMTILARQHVPSDLRWEPHDKLWLVVLLADVCKRSDEDNLFAACKEWMEDPMSPQRKAPRPWGMGMVANDRQVNGFALHSADTGMTSDCTRLIIRRYSSARPGVIQHLSDQMLGIVRDGGPCPVVR